MKNYSYYLFCICFFCIAACADNAVEPTEPIQRSAIEKLTERPWLLYEVTIDGKSQMQQMKLCALDNLYIYLRDSTYLIADATEPCNPSDDRTMKFGLTKNGDSLFHFSNGGSVENIFSVMKLSGTQLILEKSTGDMIYMWEYRN